MLVDVSEINLVSCRIIYSVIYKALWTGMRSVRLLHKFLGCPFARVQSAGVMYQNQNLMMTKGYGGLGKERKKELVNVPKYRKFPRILY